jgi:hypothetical protein
MYPFIFYFLSRLKLSKMLHFSFYSLCFFFYKIREQDGGTGSAQGVLAPFGGDRWWGKG